MPLHQTEINLKNIKERVAHAAQWQSACQSELWARRHPTTARLQHTHTSKRNYLKFNYKTRNHKFPRIKQVKLFLYYSW